MADDRHAATTTGLRGRAEYWAGLSTSVVEEIWNDRVSRWCGIASLAFLWLTAALLEPAMLALLAASVAALWFRLTHKPEVEDTFDDWF